MYFPQYTEGEEMQSLRIRTITKEEKKMICVERMFFFQFQCQFHRKCFGIMLCCRNYSAPHASDIHF